MWAKIKNSISKRIAFWTKVFGLISVMSASGASLYTVYSNHQQTKITRETAREAINEISSQMQQTRERLSKVEGKLELLTSSSKPSWFKNLTQPKFKSVEPKPAPLPDKVNTWDDYEQRVQTQQMSE